MSAARVSTRVASGAPARTTASASWRISSNKALTKAGSKLSSSRTQPPRAASKAGGGTREPDRGTHTGAGGNEHTPDAELAGEPRGVHRRRAAKGDQGARLQ